MSMNLGLSLIVHVLSVASAFQIRDSFAQKCVPVKQSQDRTYFTIKVQVGVAKKSHDLTVDTGSGHILLQDRFATSSTIRSGEERTFYYGSGACFVEQASDLLQIEAGQANQTVYMIKSGGHAFEDLEGILPLAVKEKNVLASHLFRICLGQSGGELRTISKNPVPALAASSRWALRLQSISVNDVPAVKRSMFHDASEAEALPDTGTTFMLGPTSHIHEVFLAACKAWSKCDSTSNGATGFFHAVEEHCKTDLENMPVIQFQVGKGKNNEMVTLHPSSYVIKYDGECMLAFDYFEYRPDFWILGQPLFYEHSVVFDAEKQTVGFIEDTCESCAERSSRKLLNVSAFQQLRNLDGPPRGPTYAYPQQRKVFQRKELLNLQQAFDVRRKKFG